MALIIKSTTTQAKLTFQPERNNIFTITLENIAYPYFLTELINRRSDQLTARIMKPDDQEISCWIENCRIEDVSDILAECFMEYEAQICAI